MIYWDGKNLGYHSNTLLCPNDLLGWENFRVSFQYPPPLSKEFYRDGKMLGHHFNTLLTLVFLTCE